MTFDLRVKGAIFLVAFVSLNRVPLGIWSFLACGALTENKEEKEESEKDDEEKREKNVLSHELEMETLRPIKGFGRNK